MKTTNSHRIWNKACLLLWTSLICMVGCASDGPKQECPALAGETNACALCMGRNCCSSVTTCIGSSSCESAASCVADCSTQSCDDRCESSYTPGGNQLVAVFACTNVLCESECQ